MSAIVISVRITRGLVYELLRKFDQLLQQVYPSTSMMKDPSHIHIPYVYARIHVYIQIHIYTVHIC